MGQQLIVALIVVAALAHFCTKYLPAAWRKGISGMLARRGVDAQKAARWFNVKGGGGGCGSSCGGCSAAADGAAAAAEGDGGGACANPGTGASPSAASSADGAAPRQRVITLHVQR